MAGPNYADMRPDELADALNALLGGSLGAMNPRPERPMEGRSVLRALEPEPTSVAATIPQAPRVPMAPPSAPGGAPAFRSLDDRGVPVPRGVGAAPDIAMPARELSPEMQAKVALWRSQRRQAEGATPAPVQAPETSMDFVPEVRAKAPPSFAEPSASTPAFRSLDDRGAAPRSTLPGAAPAMTGELPRTPLSPPTLSPAMTGELAKWSAAKRPAGPPAPARPPRVDVLTDEPDVPGAPDEPELAHGRIGSDIGGGMGMPGAAQALGRAATAPPEGFTRRPFSPMGRFEMPQEQAAMLMDKYGLTVDDISSLRSKREAMHNQAVASAAAAKREVSEKTFARMAKASKDLEKETVTIGPKGAQIRVSLNKYEVNPMAQALANRGMDVPIDMWLKPVDVRAKAAELAKQLPHGRGTGQNAKVIIPETGKSIGPSETETLYNALVKRGAFEELGIELPSKVTNRSRADAVQLALIISARQRTGKEFSGFAGAKPGEKDKADLRDSGSFLNHMLSLLRGATATEQKAEVDAQKATAKAEANLAGAYTIDGKTFYWRKSGNPLTPRGNKKAAAEAAAPKGNEAYVYREGTDKPPKPKTQ